jgi:hypothetical protein
MAWLLAMIGFRVDDCSRDWLACDDAIATVAAIALMAAAIR